MLYNNGHTLNDGQKDDNDEEEEADIEEDSVDLVGITIWGFDLVTDTTTGPDTLVQVEHEALKKDINRGNARARKRVTGRWMDRQRGEIDGENCWIDRQKEE